MIPKSHVPIAAGTSRHAVEGLTRATAIYPVFDWPGTGNNVGHADHDSPAGGAGRKRATPDIGLSFLLSGALSIGEASIIPSKGVEACGFAATIPKFGWSNELPR